MPTLRGERFHIPLVDEDENVAPGDMSSGDSGGFAAAGVLGDILERESAVPTAPIAPSAPVARPNSGWPSHKKRYVKKQTTTVESSQQPKESSTLSKQPESNRERDRREIDAENTRRLQAMSEDEIERERREILSSFSPELLRGFLNRKKQDTAEQVEEEPISSRPSIPERKVSFAVPPDSEEQSPTRRSSTQKHSVPSPDLASFPDLNRSTSVSSPSARPNRPSTSGRKVSFSVPEDRVLERTSTAASHSVPPTPPPVSPISARRPSSPELRRPSSARKVSFSVPEPTTAQDTSSASSHSIPASPKCLVEVNGNDSETSRRRPSNTDRKVSFSLPNDENEPRRPSATSHSIARSDSVIDSEASSTTSGSRRPSQAERKVSFATPFNDDDDNDDSRSTASHHSVPSTPQFRPETAVNIANDDAHFPHPPQPELDPESDSFLEDLHQKYFPNLAHDPSKLDWMKPVDPRESAAYDPAVTDEVHPKDIRFDFQGQIIPPSKSRSLPTNLGLHNHAAAPDAAGYTIAELAHLARSSYAPQRCIALQTLGRMLFRLGSGEFGKEEHILRKDVSGQRALLAKGLWQEVEEGHVVESISEEAKKDRGHQTSIAIAQEALWNWQRGGGSARARTAQ